MLDKYTLKIRQTLPLEDKIRLTERRIHEWVKEFGEDGVYVSFSGGKDSTVLLDIVRNLYPNIEAVYVDTGLEFPEIRNFVKTFDNVTILRPKMRFDEVIKTYGYPVIGKKQSRYIRDLQNPTEKNEATRNLRLTGITKQGKNASTQFLPKKYHYLANAPFKISEQCCDIMKKKPLKEFIKKTGKKPIIGTMAEESNLREQEYIKQGSCNAFNNKIPKSTPMAFWTEQDVLRYLKEKQIPYAPVYGEIIENDDVLKMTGEHRTGCMFCCFGVQFEKEPNRFQRMKQTHPKQYEYCINTLGIGKVLDFLGIKYE